MSFLARLGTHAFHAVLSRKSYRYGSLVKSLAFDLSLSRYRGVRKHCREVVREGLADMLLIPY
jgi:hypothetical protein